MLRLAAMMTDKPDLTPIEQLFDDLGGTSAVARIISVGQSTASEMKRRRSIPVEYWPAIVGSDRGREKAITNDRLVAAHVQERTGGSEVAA